MFLNKLKLIATSIVVTGLLTASAGVIARAKSDEDGEKRGQKTTKGDQIPRRRPRLRPLKRPPVALTRSTQPRSPPRPRKQHPDLRRPHSPRMRPPRKAVEVALAGAARSLRLRQKRGGWEGRMIP